MCQSNTAQPKPEVMGDMDSNMNLLLEAGISSAMFDIDPGDEVNHPAQQFLNSADGNQSMSVDESPNFGSLGADNVMGSPPLLPLQGDVDGGEESVLSDVVATSIADNVAAAAASAVPHPEHVEVSIPAERSLLPTVVPAAAVAASATAQSNNLFSRGAGNIASCTTSRLRQRSDSEVTRKSTAMLKEQWMSRYKELIEWKRKHGNCNVPQREKKLGCWVSTQRTQYKLLCEGRQSQMNQERIVSKQERIVGILLKVARTFDLLCVACIGTFISHFFPIENSQHNAALSFRIYCKLRAIARTVYKNASTNYHSKSACIEKCTALRLLAYSTIALRMSRHCVRFDQINK